MTDQSRIDFESWATDNGMGLHLARSESGLYVSRVTQNYFDCWQASRAAVVVEPVWPYHYNYTNSDVAGAAILDRCIAFEKAALAAGLKVKP